MAEIIHKTIKLSHIIFGSVFLAVVCVWWLLTQNGLGSTVDAKAYVYAAQSLQEKGMFLTPYGYYTNWTPLFPILLSILGSKLTQFWALALNLVLIYKISQHLVNKQDTSLNLLKYTSFVHIAYSTVFLMVHFFVWSEAWFMVFLLVCILQIQKLERPSHWLLLILWSNLLCLERMAGIFFVAIFALWLWAHFSWAKALFYGFGSSLGLGAWFIRNAFLQQKPDFLDNIFMVSWHESFLGYAEAFLNIFMPAQYLPNFLKISLFGVLVLGLGYIIFQKHLSVLTRLLAASIVGYVTMMLIFRMNVSGESERYLSPILPLIVFVFWQIMAWLLGKYKCLSVQIGICTIGSCIIVYNLLRTYKNVAQWLATPPDLITF